MINVLLSPLQNVLAASGFSLHDIINLQPYRSWVLRFTNWVDVSSTWWNDHSRWISSFCNVLDKYFSKHCLGKRLRLFRKFKTHCRKFDISLWLHVIPAVFVCLISSWNVFGFMNTPAVIWLGRIIFRYLYFHCFLWNPMRQEKICWSKWSWILM